MILMTRSNVAPQSMWDTIRSQVVRTVGNIFTRSFTSVKFRTVIFINNLTVVLIKSYFSQLRLLHSDAAGVSLPGRGGQAEADAVPQEGQEAQVGRGEVQQDQAGDSNQRQNIETCFKFLLLQGINTVELDLQKIRDPLQIHVPSAKKGDKSLGAGGGFFGINNLRDVISKLQ